MTSSHVGLTKSGVLIWSCLLGITHFACSSEAAEDGSSGGVSDGGGVTGGAASGGASTGGASVGGFVGTGGGAATGGIASTGGAVGTGSTTSTGGVATGGAGSGGVGTGGSAAGGTSGTGGSGAGGSGGSPHTGTWKIMPFGDSITGSGCFRAKLQAKLATNGFTDVDFIGSRSGPSGCGVASYDMNNEGHGGYIASHILKTAGTGVRPSGADGTDPFVSDVRDLDTWFGGVSPDVLLMHWGTNDVWNNVAPQTILQAYSSVLTRVRARNPNVVVLVAQIIPMNPSGCADCNSRVGALNAQIPTWATANATATSPITVVNQNQGYDVSWNTDGVHPNANEGSQAIADKWYAALSEVL